MKQKKKRIKKDKRQNYIHKRQTKKILYRYNFLLPESKPLKYKQVRMELKEKNVEIRKSLDLHIKIVLTETYS